MRQIIRRREIVADEWHYAGEPGAADDVRTVKPLASVLEALQAGTEVPAGSGVRLGPTDEPQLLAPLLGRLALIVIEFPSPGDGRGLSQAHTLRQRYHYRGELRAVGAVKRDYLFFMARCGFDAFDLDRSEDLSAALGMFKTFSVAYQPGSSDVVQVRERSDAR